MTKWYEPYAQFPKNKTIHAKGAVSMSPEWYTRLENDLPETVPLDLPPSEKEEEAVQADTISIRDGAGELLLAIQNDGSVYLPDPERVEEAAVLFWKAVEEMAQIRGWTVRRSL